MKRRDMLKLSLAATAAGLATSSHAQQACPTDGTPAQFTPKKPADTKPLENELGKYTHCPYCGMDRREHHRARMLVQYSDDLVDGICSIHCLSLSLGVNIDREPKNIWGPDYGATAEPRPLVPVEQLTYLIGADLKHAMTKRSKHSFASREIAEQFRLKHGGTFGDFDEALKQSYLDMAADVAQIRRNREERRKKMMEQKRG
ncbi:MAG: twin-arginine translocation pathway signal protein [Rhodocyclaceae bacterium]|nr:twin-arginine translocation pathway signal protein [Rhodocyclaceae bacterium]HNQ56097.1 nitrous oxide reductase accessory protein NosL [Candidatus Desulfobacillus denitrificans]HNT63875.1 nitrous oxide reductase accessory protein NosL [Candidatus Desulfobacillus denitrificans]